MRFTSTGRWIQNEDGDKVILRGVNIASLEWKAAGENVLQSLVVAADSWGVNFVRIPMCQDRWFGKAPEQNDKGRNYQHIVDQLVQTCIAKKIYILLELHWNDAENWGQYIGQHKMPDANSVTFWKSLAVKYANVPVVLFGLYNEPHDVSWEVWLNGGQVAEQFDSSGHNVQLSYKAVGHQALYDTVRSTGAVKNLVVVGGLDWGYDLTGVLAGKALAGENIVYDTHCYPWKSTNWDGMFGNVGRKTAILVGEWGGNFSEGYESYARKLAKYLRDNKFCWSAWDFHPSAGPTLIRDWTYAPTPLGQLVKDELAIPVVVDSTGN